MEQSYKEKYERALAKAKEQYNYPCMRSCMGILEEIFPELAESDGEKVREELIKHLKEGAEGYEPAGGSSDYQRWLAWLEKQGESSICNIPSKEIILAIWDLGNEWKELTGGSISTEYGTQLKYIQNHWHESEYYLRAMQNEQKLIDKVEPKFKVGEWITNGDYTWKIVEVKPLDYILQSQDGNVVDDTISHVDEQFHSFTIQDAKDGDVLYINNTVSESIMIYKSFNNGLIKKYASYNKFGFEGEHYLTLNDGYIIPATKEQRDLLFQKMKEAGYEWNADTKELKKIEKRSSWSEEDEKMMAAIEHHLNNCGASIKSILWLKSIKDRVQPKQEYSEEDAAKLSDFDKALLTAVGTIVKNPQVYENSASKLEEFILSYSTKLKELAQKEIPLHLHGKK